MSSLQSPSATSRFGLFFLVGSLLAVFAIWGVLRYLADAKKAPTRAATKVQSTPPPPVASPASTGSAPDATADAAEKMRTTVSQALAVLRDPTNPNKKAALVALKEALRSADPKVAAGVIRQFLDSKEDAKTGLKFRVGDDHELDEAPTLRTFMMDQLGDISLGAGLGDAMEAARATLQSKDSADEWAVAMRNLALGDPDGSRSFLAGKVKEMIDYAPWQQSPTGGYLEAFDVAVYAADPSILNELAPMTTSSSNGLKQASQVALSRLSSLSADQVSTYLNNNPSVLSDVPLLRADYMGNMDLSTPTQVSQAENYLARTDVTDDEKSKFIGRLGLPASFVSDNLVTPSTTDSSIFDRLARVNQTATNWLASGKYPTLQNALETVILNTKQSSSP